MDIEGSTAQLTAEQFAQIDAALTRFEEAIGYGEQGLAGFSGCITYGHAMAAEVVALTADVDWDSQCTCEAPEMLFPRLVMLWSLIAWIPDRDLNRVAANTAYLVDFANSVRAAALDPELVDEPGLTAREQRQFELALYLWQSANARDFAESDLVEKQDRLDLGSVAGWWRAMERMIDDPKFAVDHRAAAEEAMLLHRWNGLDERHAQVMQRVWSALEGSGIDEPRAVRDRVRETLHEIKRDASFYAAPSECRCPTDTCVVPATPWMGFRRNVGLR